MLESGSRRMSGGADESDGGRDLHGQGKAVETKPETGHVRTIGCPTLGARKGPLTCGDAYFAGSF